MVESLNVGVTHHWPVREIADSRTILAMGSWQSHRRKAQWRDRADRSSVKRAATLWDWLLFMPVVQGEVGKPMRLRRAMALQGHGLLRERVVGVEDAGRDAAFSCCRRCV